LADEDDLKANLASPSFTGTVNLSSTTTALAVNSSAGILGQFLRTSGPGATPTWADATGWLKPTVIRSSAYTAIAGDLVRCNSTTGSFTVTLPTAPVDGDLIGVMDLYSTSSINPIILAPAGSKTIEGSAIGLSINISGAVVVVSYSSVTNNWKIASTPAVTNGVVSVNGQTGVVTGIATTAQVNLKADIASPTFTGTVGGITKTMVGLANVDNTTDVAKPVSTLQQAALNLKANSASPTFTGAIADDGSVSSNITVVPALNIDCSLGNYFTKTIAANSTFTVSNVPVARAYAFTLELLHTSGTVTWFAGVQFSGQTAPTLTIGRTHLFTFITDDGGARWRGVANVNYTT
jgi:hypothetical protein